MFEKYSTFETLHVQKMISTTRTETIFDVSDTENCAAINDITNFFFALLEKLIAKMTCCGALERTYNKSFKCWSQSNTITLIVIAQQNLAQALSKVSLKNITQLCTRKAYTMVHPSLCTPENIDYSSLNAFALSRTNHCIFLIWWI